MGSATKKPSTVFANELRRFSHRAALMEERLKIALNPSRHLVLWLCLAHASAAVATLLVDLPLMLRLAAVLIIAASCGYYVYGNALLRSEKAIVLLDIGEPGKLTFQTRHGTWHDGILLGSSFVSAYMAILNIKTEGELLARHVVIMPDSTGEDEFRRLRVRLRWSGAPTKR